MKQKIYITVKLRKPWTPENFQECWLCTGQSQESSGYTSKPLNHKLTAVAVCRLLISHLIGLFLATQYHSINLYFWCSQFCGFHHNWTQTYFTFQRKKKTIHISTYFTHHITCKLHETKQKLLGVGVTKSVQANSQEWDVSIKSYY